MAKPTNLLSKKEASLETTSPERLIQLAKESEALAKVVAKNPKAPAFLLEELGSSSLTSIRKAVTTNPNTPTSTLLQLGIQFPEALVTNPIFDSLFLQNPNLLADISKLTLKN